MIKRSEIPSPSVVIEKSVLEHNIAVIQAQADRHGILMRPHIKTHKTPQIAKMQIEAGAVGITCAKVGEAKVMADAGIKDIFIAYPTIQDYKIRDALDLPAKVYLAFDSLYGAEVINRVSREKNTVTDVYIIVDTGLDRDGVNTTKAALALAGSASKLRHLNIMGLFTHEGHVYAADGKEAVQAAARASAELLLEMKEALKSVGVYINVVSTGATPSVYFDATLPGVTEWRPGQYVFYDTEMYSLGVDLDVCALGVRTTISSHPAPGRYIIDAGSKVFSSDLCARHEGHGLVREDKTAILERLNEEHGILRAAEGSFQLGQVIEVIPNHCCTAVNLSEKLYIVDGEDLVDVWDVAARGKYV